MLIVLLEHSRQRMIIKNRNAREQLNSLAFLKYKSFNSSLTEPDTHLFYCKFPIWKMETVSDSTETQNNLE